MSKKIIYHPDWFYSISKKAFYNKNTKKWSNDLKRFKRYMTGVVK